VEPTAWFSGRATVRFTNGETVEVEPDRVMQR
jgi:hypothetical protein